MYKTKEEIEKEFDKKFIGYNIFDDSFTRIIMDYVNEIKLYIHQIRQDDKEYFTKEVNPMIVGNFEAVADKNERGFSDGLKQGKIETLKAVIKIIKEKGLHLGYKNDILDKIDNLNK